MGESLKLGHTNRCYDLNGNLPAYEENLKEINPKDSNAIYLFLGKNSTDHYAGHFYFKLKIQHGKEKSHSDICCRIENLLL